jgi:hypothetical protein
LNWIASSSNYFAVGPDYYEQIDADNLGLYIHGNQIISYPTTGSTWYDISGQNNRFNLINGPTYNTNGWINFDGSDDYAVAVNTTLPSNATSSFTLMAVARTSGGGAYQTVLGTGGLFSQIGFVSNNSFMYGRNAGSGGLLYSNGGAIVTGRFYHLTMTYNGSTATAYLNGVATQTGVNIGSNGGTNGVHILSTYTPSAASEILTGDIARALVYPKALTQAEVLQNYYGGPIVTDGLIFAVDAGNLVSYPKSGTSWYNLTGSVDGTLTNGPTFSPADGGELIFDGTDDYIDFGNPGSLFNPATSTMTMMGWIYVKNNQTNILIGLQESGAGSLSLGTNSSGNVRFICRPTAGSQGTIDSSATLALNTWYHIAMTKDTATSISDCTLWINGSPVNTASSTVNFPTSTAAIRSAYYFDANIYSNINIGSIQVYNRALTAAEVLQNYNATK